MMRKIWYFLTDTRHLTIFGLTAMAGLFYLGAQVMELALIWAIAATAVMLALAGLVWLWRVLRAKRDSASLADGIGTQVWPRCSRAIRPAPRSRRSAMVC